MGVKLKTIPGTTLTSGLDVYNLIPANAIK